MKEIKDMTFCNNRKCKNIECLRYYKNAPYEVLCSWLRKTPEQTEDGKCKFYIN